MNEPTQLESYQRLLSDLSTERRMALEDAHAGTFRIDLDSGSFACSDELLSLYGVAAGQFSGAEDWIELVVPEDRAQALSEYNSVFASISPTSSRFRIRRADTGEVRSIAARYVVVSADQRPASLVGINTDVTESLRAEQEFQNLESRLRHAQKMELIGHLASGVAHDFNNLLMIIRSHVEMLELKLSASADVHRYTSQVLIASERAAALTAQLLSVSRKQSPRPAILDLSAEIKKSTEMLQRLLGASIQVRLLTARSLWRVRADADQISQVLMNLVVNSRDAMPKGGTITIETRNATFNEDTLADNVKVPRGEYVVLSVRDTGLGISREHMDHMFDPFFTTKPEGRGTGLGLSIVYGIVKQANGYIGVTSEIGTGTTFAIYLPRTEANVGHKTEAWPQPRDIGTALVVDNDVPMREAACEFLRKGGYTTLSAVNGEQALLISGRCPTSINLLIADVELGGRELYTRVGELHPKVKVIYTKSSADAAELERAENHTSAAFLRKPFTLTELARAMQDLRIETASKLA